MKVLMNMWSHFLYGHIGDYFANTEIEALRGQFPDMKFVQVEAVNETALANLRTLTVHAAHKLRLLNKNIKTLQPLFNLQCTSYLSEGYLRKIRPDVIFAHSHIPRIGNQGSVPLVAVEYLASERYREKSGVLQCLPRDIEAKRWATERANIIVTTTPGSKRRFEDWVPEARERLLQIPIYMPYLEPIEEDEVTRKAQGGGYINALFIGGAARRKGLPQVLDALHMLPKPARERLKLTVVSSFEDGTVPGLELHAEIMSHVSGAQLSNLLRSAHIFLFPTQFESYGRVIVEAMAFGCAIISSNTDPQDWILDFGKAGILVNPESAEEIADALMMLIENRQYRLDLSISASKRFRDVFYHLVTGKQYRRAFDMAIEKKIQ